MGRILSASRTAPFDLRGETGHDNATGIAGFTGPARSARLESGRGDLGRRSQAARPSDYSNRTIATVRESQSRATGSREDSNVAERKEDVEMRVRSNR
jgi:hypothetical protein